MTHILERLQQQLRASRGLRERTRAVSSAATPSYRNELQAIFQRDEDSRAA